MKNLNVREVRQELAHLEELLAQEGELVITRRGKPVARVLPFEPQAAAAAAPRRVPSMKWLRDQMRYQETPAAVLIREDRDARG